MGGRKISGRTKQATRAERLLLPLAGGCLDGRMTGEDAPRAASASREIAAEPGRVFKLIADPAQQPRWDGNDNLAVASNGQLTGYPAVFVNGVPYTVIGIASGTRCLVFSPEDLAIWEAAPAEVPGRPATVGCRVCRDGGYETGVSRWRGRRGTSAIDRG